MNAIGIILLPIVLAALVVLSAVFVYVLDRPRFEGVRDSLARSKYKPLAFVIPFSPAMTMVVSRLAPKALIGAFPAVATGMGAFIGSIGAAAFAACWLCLPKDPAVPMRYVPVALLAITFWILDIIALVLFASVFHWH